jgi:hypothetical protein
VVLSSSVVTLQWLPCSGYPVVACPVLTYPAVVTLQWPPRSCAICGGYPAVCLPCGDLPCSGYPAVATP